MKKYFIVSVKFNRKIEGDGEASSKSVTEQIMMDAVNYTDAEKRINEYMEVLTKEGECAGPFSIPNIAQKEFRDIFLNAGEDEGNFYETKVTHFTFDNEKEREVKTTLLYLVQGFTFDDARNLLKLVMDEIEGGYEINSLVKSKILGVQLIKASESEIN